MARCPSLWVSTYVDEKNRAERTRTPRRSQRAGDSVRARRMEPAPRAEALRLRGRALGSARGGLPGRPSRGRRESVSFRREFTRRVWRPVALRVPRLTVVVGLSAGPLPRGRSPARPPRPRPVPQARPVLTHLARVFLRDAQCFARAFLRNEQTRSRAPATPPPRVSRPTLPFRARPRRSVLASSAGPRAVQDSARHVPSLARPAPGVDADAVTSALTVTPPRRAPRGRAGAACPADSAVRWCGWAAMVARHGLPPVGGACGSSGLLAGAAVRRFSKFR